MRWKEVVRLSRQDDPNVALVTDWRDVQMKEHSWELLLASSTSGTPFSIRKLPSGHSNWIVRPFRLGDASLWKFIAIFLFFLPRMESTQLVCNKSADVSVPNWKMDDKTNVVKNRPIKECCPLVEKRFYHPTKSCKLLFSFYTLAHLQDNHIINIVLGSPFLQGVELTRQSQSVNDLIVMRRPLSQSVVGVSVNHQPVDRKQHLIDLPLEFLSLSSCVCARLWCGEYKRKKDPPGPSIWTGALMFPTLRFF